MVDVLLQAGHNYPEGTGSGAPGERQWARDLCDAMTPHLRARGLTTETIGGFYRLPVPAIATQPHGLFLSNHYDAAIYWDDQTGAFFDRAAGDPMFAESDRLIRILERIYPERVGIPLRNNRRNANTSGYYAFAATHPQTPGVLAECGVGQGWDKDILFNRIDLVADTLSRGVVEFFGLEWGDAPVEPEPVEEPTPVIVLPEPDPCHTVIEGLRLANLQKREFESYARDWTHRASVNEAAKLEGINPVDLMLRWAQDHYNAGHSVV